MGPSSISVEAEKRVETYSSWLPMSANKFPLPSPAACGQRFLQRCLLGSSLSAHTPLHCRGGLATRLDPTEVLFLENLWKINQEPSIHPNQNFAPRNSKKKKE